MNNVVLIGRLTKDPELKKTSNNISYCKITLAVNRAFNNEKTDFIPVTIWRAQAENTAKHLSKGSLVAIQGSIQVSSFSNNENQQVYRTDIQANTVKFLGSKPNNNRSNFQPASNVQTAYNNNKNLNNVFLNDSKKTDSPKQSSNDINNNSNVFDDDPWSEDL